MVSRISVSMVTWPLNLGSKMSLMLVSSRPVFLGLYPMPVIPESQGTLNLRPGSKLTSRRLSSRLARLGNLESSRGRTVSQVDQPAGHPVGQHDDVAVDALVPFRGSLILAKNSLLSLISSVYSALIPVAFSKSW